MLLSFVDFLFSFSQEKLYSSSLLFDIGFIFSPILPLSQHHVEFLDWCFQSQSSIDFRFSSFIVKLKTQCDRRFFQSSWCFIYILIQCSRYIDAWKVFDEMCMGFGFVWCKIQFGVILGGSIVSMFLDVHLVSVGYFYSWWMKILFKGSTSLDGSLVGSYFSCTPIVQWFSPLMISLWSSLFWLDCCF